MGFNSINLIGKQKKRGVFTPSEKGRYNMIYTKKLSIGEIRQEKREYD